MSDGHLGLVECMSELYNPYKKDRYVPLCSPCVPPVFPLCSPCVPLVFPLCSPLCSPLCFPCVPPVFPLVFHLCSPCVSPCVFLVFPLFPLWSPCIPRCVSPLFPLRNTCDIKCFIRWNIIWSQKTSPQRMTCVSNYLGYKHSHVVICMCFTGWIDPPRVNGLVWFYIYCFTCYLMRFTCISHVNHNHGSQSLSQLHICIYVAFSYVKVA